MDYSKFEIYDFESTSNFYLSYGHKGRGYQYHWHSYGELILIEAGDTNIYKVGKNTYDLKPGDFLIVWPMEMHTIVDADVENAVIIKFSNTFVNTFFDLQKIMHLFRYLHKISADNHSELSGRLREITQKMKDIFLSGDQEREIKCCMLFMNFMLTLLEYRSDLVADIEGEEISYTDDVMQRMIMVTDYIKHNLTADDLSQNTMAKMAGISRDYFSRIFKNVTGKNYSKWLNMIRLEKAAELLSQNDISLTEVAMFSGFQSISSFNRVFREEMGMSPRSYRALFVKK